MYKVKWKHRFYVTKDKLVLAKNNELVIVISHHSYLWVSTCYEWGHTTMPDIHSYLLKDFEQHYELQSVSYWMDWLLLHSLIQMNHHNEFDSDHLWTHQQSVQHLHSSWLWIELLLLVHSSSLLLNCILQENTLWMNEMIIDLNEIEQCVLCLVIWTSQ